MREEILEILKDINPNIDYENEKKIIDDQLYDSFDIVQLVVALNDAFDIEIDVDELEPVNFNSLEGMIALVEQKQEEM